MKKLIFELRTFLKEDYHPFTYIFTILFLAVSLSINYYYQFEDTVIDSYYGKPSGFVIYFLFYAFPYYTITVVSLISKKQQYKLKNPEFWVKSFVFIGLFSYITAFSQYRPFVKSFSENNQEYFFLLKAFGNLKRIIPFILVFYILKRIYDSNDSHIYGLRFKGLNYRPFFIMLLMMVPVIAAVSFQESFQHAYPRFKHWYFPEVFNFSEPEKIFWFELAYGLDFISIEFLFRGALIVGMAKVLKKEAVLPMVAFYVFIHFGKPALEAISTMVLLRHRTLFFEVSSASHILKFYPLDSQWVDRLL
ncbi:MAG: hypothetical protein U9N85_06900 [Bacteroidota bacterium]|nr:hypothetical protein [Bacteroidota bacterium]